MLNPGLFPETVLSPAGTLSSTVKQLCSRVTLIEALSENEVCADPRTSELGDNNPLEQGWARDQLGGTVGFPGWEAKLSNCSH